MKKLPSKLNYVWFGVFGAVFLITFFVIQLVIVPMFPKSSFDQVRVKYSEGLNETICDSGKPKGNPFYLYTLCDKGVKIYFPSDEESKQYPIHG